MAHKFPLVAAHLVTKFQTNLMNRSFKMCNNVPKLALIIGLISIIKNFLGKKGDVTFFLSWMPNFMQNFRKTNEPILRKWV